MTEEGNKEGRMGEGAKAPKAAAEKGFRDTIGVDAESYYSPLLRSSSSAFLPSLPPRTALGYLVAAINQP